VNECANASETGTRIESEKMIEHANGCESKIGIENETMTECTNGSESENRIVNRSANKNSMAESHTFSVKDAACGPIFGRLTAYILGLACAPRRSFPGGSAQETRPRSTPSLGDQPSPRRKAPYHARNG
jgi:hypothetical protein